MLQSHEEDYRGPVVPKGANTLRLVLGVAAPEPTVPSIVVVARASAFAPKGWAAGTSSTQEGLPILASHILGHLGAVRGRMLAYAVLHACSFVRTRCLPAPAFDNSTAEDDEHLRWHLRRAFMFTRAIKADIKADIKAANNVGIVPTILSVGNDAWTCNTKAFRSWLHENRYVQFELVLTPEST